MSRATSTLEVLRAWGHTSLSELSSDDTYCRICYEDYDTNADLVLLKCCGKSLHMPCAEQWISTFRRDGHSYQQSCPICRNTNLRQPSLVVFDSFRDLLEHTENILFRIRKIGELFRELDVQFFNHVPETGASYDANLLSAIWCSCVAPSLELLYPEVSLHVEPQISTAIFAGCDDIGLQPGLFRAIPRTEPHVRQGAPSRIFLALVIAVRSVVPNFPGNSVDFGELASASRRMRSHLLRDVITTVLLYTRALGLYRGSML
jgi:hypothetical protein